MIILLVLVIWFGIEVVPRVIARDFTVEIIIKLILWLVLLLLLVQSLSYRGSLL